VGGVGRGRGLGEKGGLLKEKDKGPNNKKKTGTRFRERGG